MTPFKSLRYTPVYLAILLACASSHAESIEDLRAEILHQRAVLEAQQNRLDALEKNQAAAAKATQSTPHEAVVGGDVPGSYKLPGTDTSVRLSGWINLTAFKDFNQPLGSKFSTGNISPNGSPSTLQKGNISMNSKLNRLMLETFTPNTAIGPVHTMLATDFFGSEKKTDAQEGLGNNSYHMRIVHAYAEMGGLLIGQTWSNFIDDPDSAETLDSAGPAGVPGERTPQVRYTIPLSAGGAISFAAENPVGDYQLPGSSTASSYAISTTNRIPDLTAKYEIGGYLGHAQVSGIYRKFNVVDTAGNHAATSGTGVILGGTLNLGATHSSFGRDNVGGELWYGDGIGHYVPDDFGQPTAFAVNGLGSPAISAQGQKLKGANVWYRHFWSPKWRSTFAYGEDAETFASFVVAASDQAESIRTMHANLFYSPIPSVSLGLEFAHGAKTFRKELGLSDGAASRVVLGARIKF